MQNHRIRKTFSAPPPITFNLRPSWKGQFDFSPLVVSPIDVHQWGDAPHNLRKCIRGPSNISSTVNVLSARDIRKRDHFRFSTEYPSSPGKCAWECAGSASNLWQSPPVVHQGMRGAAEVCRWLPGSMGRAGWSWFALVVRVTWRWQQFLCNLSNIIILFRRQKKKCRWTLSFPELGVLLLNITRHLFFFYAKKWGILPPFDLSWIMDLLY